MLSNIDNPQSICVLRLSAIGDVCHAVATVQAIQRRWPSVKITWIIGKIEASLLSGMPGVQFIVFDKQAGFKAYRDLYLELRARRFDILLHMQLALRASLASLCVRAIEKWGFNRSRVKEGQSLFVNHQISELSGGHVADGFLDFAKAIGVPADTGLVWHMPIAQQEIDWQAEQFSKLGSYVVISPAASKAERNWLPERYAAFANYVNQQGKKVVICGGPSDMEVKLAEEINTFCNFEPINWVGKTSLKQLLVVLKEAELLLAPDTGPTHMAVTVGTPVIGLYAHSNPRRTGPYTCQDYVVSCYDQVLEEQTGRAVGSHRWGKRVKGESLMARITLDAVIDKYEKIIRHSQN